MIVYHGSTEIIEKPDVSFSKDFLDFGKGFYVTTHKEQAEKWALKIFISVGFGTKTGRWKSCATIK